MGGNGSGQRSNSKSTTSSYYQLDVRRWGRAGLVAGKSFASQGWRIDVAPYFDVFRKPDHAIVSSHTGIESILRLAWTRCHYGGGRAWFLCPNRSCGRRVAILYSPDRVAFGCRHCLQLAYDSQQESTWHRRLHRAQAIRMKLGGSPSLADPFPTKPKGMHWRTYRRLYSKALLCEVSVFGVLRTRLGL